MSAGRSHTVAFIVTRRDRLGRKYDERELVDSDHPAANEDDPTVFVIDRESGAQVGVPLSLFRMMAKAVDHQAERHS